MAMKMKTTISEASRTFVISLSDMEKRVDESKRRCLDKFYQPTIYMSSEDYTKYAVRTFEAERATVERLGLAKKS